MDEIRTAIIYAENLKRRGRLGDAVGDGRITWEWMLQKVGKMTLTSTGSEQWPVTAFVNTVMNLRLL
jgi:hypothetical protein